MLDLDLKGRFNQMLIKNNNLHILLYWFIILKCNELFSAHELLGA